MRPTHGMGPDDARAPAAGASRPAAFAEPDADELTRRALGRGRDRSRAPPQRHAGRMAERAHHAHVRTLGILRRATSSSPASRCGPASTTCGSGCRSPSRPGRWRRRACARIGASAVAAGSRWTSRPRGTSTVRCAGCAAPTRPPERARVRRGRRPREERLSRVRDALTRCRHDAGTLRRAPRPRCGRCSPAGPGATPAPSCPPR